MNNPKASDIPLGINHLQNNKSMFDKFSLCDKKMGLEAFHKAGHALLYLHLKVPFEAMSIMSHDAIEDDLSYESLQNSNRQGQFISIALAGIVMEELVLPHYSKTATADIDVDKANLLIRIQNRHKGLCEPEDDTLAFLLHVEMVSSILLIYQKEAGRLASLLLEKESISYQQVVEILNQN